MADAKNQATENKLVTNEYTVHIDDKDIKIISIFDGTETASKLLYDLAVNRILYEKSPNDKQR